MIDDVLVTHYAALNSLPRTSLTGLVNQLYTAELISNEVRETFSMEECIAEFKASFSFLNEISEVQDHCQKFLNSFIAVKGSCTSAAKFLRQKWIQDIKSKIGIDFIINIDV